MNIEVIKDILRNPKNQHVIVMFKKANGELRNMRCTLNLELIPEDNYPLGTAEQKSDKEETACRVFDLDVGEWRSFRYDSIIYVTEYPKPITIKPNDPPKITRLEVISPNGRQYVNNNINDICYSLQDDGKTLKLFIGVTPENSGFQKLVLDKK